MALRVLKWQAYQAPRAGRPCQLLVRQQGQPPLGLRGPDRHLVAQDSLLKGGFQQPHQLGPPVELGHSRDGLQAAPPAASRAQSDRHALAPQLLLHVLGKLPACMRKLHTGLHAADDFDQRGGAGRFALGTHRVPAQMPQSQVGACHVQ